jgi:ribosomal protein S18 acetylase RimI-like enzyme
LTAELVLRPTAPADLPALAAFFTERFGHPMTAEEWSWKYGSLPGEARSFLAVDPADSGSLLAHAGALCLPARRQEREVGVWQLVDWAGTTRRRGLRPPLIELGRRLLADLPRADDAPFLFGFPSERHFRLGERAFGYRPLAEVTELGGPLPTAAVELPAVASGDSCGDWAAAAWEACGVAGVRRSAAFLNWRYYARPGRYYRFYRLASQGIEGLAVFAFVGEEAWGAELWLPPGGADGAGGRWYAPLLAVAADLRGAGLRRWRFWPPPPELRLDATLAALGLAPAGERRFIGCRGALGAEGDPAAAARGFRFAMGDYDLV